MSSSSIFGELQTSDLRYHSPLVHDRARVLSHQTVASNLRSVIPRTSRSFSAANVGPKSQYHSRTTASTVRRTASDLRRLLGQPRRFEIRPFAPSARYAFNNRNTCRRRAPATELLPPSSAVSDPHPAALQARQLPIAHQPNRHPKHPPEILRAVSSVIGVSARFVQNRQVTPNWQRSDILIGRLQNSVA
jgi:hypothetical protein